MDWFSEIDLLSGVLNVLLLIVTGSTVYYASRALSKEHSPQVTINRYKEGINIKEKYPYSWEVTINNYGKGYVIKAFVLLTIIPERKRKKIYMLSKPFILIKPNETESVKIVLKSKDFMEISKDNFDTSVQVVYQNSLNHFFTVKPGMELSDNSHLEKFDKLPKRIRKYNISWWHFRYKVNKAKGTNTTYPRMNKFERDMILEDAKEILNDFKFMPIENEDIK